MGLEIAVSSERTRPSAAERAHVADVLRRACVEERLSSETFSARLDLVFAARTRAELDRLVADVPAPLFPRRMLLSAVAWSSRLLADVRLAWRLPRTPRLVFPAGDTVVVGRSRACDFVVADEAVSARHAILFAVQGEWVIRDAGSRNGTFVNGWRVTDEVQVRPGDTVTFGRSSFVLTPRSP